jgi:4-carboxymuconolactone decarboxylase
VLLQVGIYCGIPAAMDSFRVAREALAEAAAAQTDARS